VESLPGTYALVLIPSNTKPINMGKIGVLRVQPGFYFYVGSAFGPGGLKARLDHHKKTTTRARWHIDYLRRQTKLKDIWDSLDPMRREHQWAEVMASIEGVSVPLSGFGSSDCDCNSHLFFI
jgi:Uri superfamily endonuclease